MPELTNDQHSMLGAALKRLEEDLIDLLLMTEAGAATRETEG